MALAVLVLVIDALLLARPMAAAALADRRHDAAPASLASGLPRAGRPSVAQSPWDEDHTRGRYPDQNPFHVPGET